MAEASDRVFRHAVLGLWLLLFSTLASAVPLSMMSQEELQALPDAFLAEYGRYRVKPGETTYGLAKRMGMDADEFHSFNHAAYVFGAQPDNLQAGAVVMLGNPLETKKVIGTGAFQGRYSLHEYELLFNGRVGKFGNSVECRWSVAWPEKECGLLPQALKNLQDLIITSCFSRMEAMSVDRDNPPQMETIEEAEAVFMSLANSEVKLGDTHWEFFSLARLSWPFGLKWTEEVRYRRPVIVFTNDGYSNNCGNGCHSFFQGFILSIPDGLVLKESDYFQEDKLEELAELVGKRMLEKYGEQREEIPKLNSGKGCWLTLSEEGMTWSLEPYSLFCGAIGVAQVTIPWNDLQPFLR